MTYKEKKLKELKESYKKAYKDILPDEVLEKGNSWYEDFLSSTIDEILGCLPAESENKDWNFHEGFMVCRNLFLLNLEQKAGEV